MKLKGLYILLVVGLLLASCAPQATPTQAPATQAASGTGHPGCAAYRLLARNR